MTLCVVQTLQSGGGVPHMYFKLPMRGPEVKGTTTPPPLGHNSSQRSPGTPAPLPQSWHPMPPP